MDFIEYVDSRAIDASSDVPLYRQLHRLLREQILSGMLRPGEQMPSERQLGAAFGISRNTVRRATGLLLKENLAYRQQGRGIFVSSVNKDQCLQLVGFSEDMERHGLSHTTRVEQAECIDADHELAAHLEIKEGAPVYALKRVRLMYGVPIGIEWAYLPCEYLPDLEAYDFSKVSLYETLEKELEIRLDHAEQSIRARPPLPEECEMLNVSPSSALLEIERRTYDSYARVIEYCLCVYNSERYTLQFFLNRH
jgi:GntR family transcriptional regulator